MIDIKALEEAFAPITQVGRGETTLEVNGQRVVLRTLLPEEDVEVFRYANEILQENADGADKVERHVMMEYLNVFRVEVLAHAVVQIGNLDLRTVEWVATGQQTDTGKPVRVKRHVAVRDLILKKQPWSTAMRELAYTKYTDLLDQIGRESEDLVEWDPADLQAEIDRVDKRLRDLKQTMESRTAGDPNLMREQVAAIRQYDEANRRVARGAPPATATPEPPLPPAAQESEPEVQAPTPEVEWADFDVMPRTAVAQEPEVVVPKRTVPRQPVLPPSSPPPTAGPGVLSAPQPVPSTRDALADVMDSFEDPSDEAVLAAEQARVLAARRQLVLEQQQAARSGASSAASRPRAVPPPHLRGRAAELAGPSIDATPIGNVGGIPAFRLPTQELSDRGRGREPLPADNPVTSDINPRFRKPNGR